MYYMILEIIQYILHVGRDFNPSHRLHFRNRGPGWKITGIAGRNSSSC